MLTFPHFCPGRKMNGAEASEAPHKKEPLYNANWALGLILTQTCPSSATTSITSYTPCVAGI